MLMKTKERRKIGVRCQVSGVRKKVRGPESEVRGRDDKARSPKPYLPECARRGHSGFCLLTPVSCLLYLNMKVTPGMLMKTKDGEKRCQVSGARSQGRVRSHIPGNTRSSHSVSCLLSPASYFRACPPRALRLRFGLKFDIFILSALLSVML
jgi:hypothetical protein